ncbi:phosphotransferase family protein [Micromonospora sp. 4G55]|uniref:phosphotransferase family protein n=1 Tax=Micromonospora sp. 4G55 TaxID=2806102 RepID=UPI001A512619|nr:hypothetical protein [Micromonospora sp. 4G55]MBM0259247.1 hypothetical protein [Micromonospora sp. 4G55]
MSSPTQRLLDPDQVRRYVASSLGPDVAVTDCAPLAGGGFAAVWSATLDDGRDVVLKVGPPPEVPLLRYERGLIAAEARYLRLVAARAPEVPVPPLLHHGSDPVLGDWLLTGLLAGRTLHQLTVDGAPVDAVRAGLGAALIPGGLGVLFGHTSVALLGPALTVLAVLLLLVHALAGRRSVAVTG